MSVTRTEFERIKAAVERADPDEPLTAREILDLVERDGVEVDSAHRVATVLGRHARSDELDVIRDRPYRYQFG